MNSSEKQMRCLCQLAASRYFEVVDILENKKKCLVSETFQLFLDDLGE